MPVPETAVLEALNAAGEGLRATFFWRVDRYAHRIDRIEGGIATPLLESVEGSNLDRWPPSPPLQQLTVEPLSEGRPVALLVGMAGASHWSLCAEREPDATALVFDVACRVKEADARLGSAYRSLVRHELKGPTALLHRAGGQGQPAAVELLPVSHSPAAPQITVDGRGVLIAAPAANSANQTVRWKYRVSLG